MQLEDSGRYIGEEIDGGGFVIYDAENVDAWIQSDDVVELG